jgi:hypothetical protein
MNRKKKRRGPLPIRQAVDVTADDTLVSFQSLSGYRLIRPEEGRLPEFLSAHSDARELGAALIAALDRCRWIPPEDSEFPNFNNMDTFYRTYKETEHEILRRTGRETEFEAYKNMIWCRVRRTEGEIEIRPFRPKTPGTWEMLPEEMFVKIPETMDPDAVGAAFVLALERGRTFAAMHPMTTHVEEPDDDEELDDDEEAWSP